MAARVKISMSPEEYLAGLRKLEAETQKSANKMENSFKQYGTSINKAGIAMRYVSAEMGAGAVAFGRAFQVLAGGKIAVAVAAITGAFVGLKKIWDELTVSSEEYKNKLNDQVEANDKNLDSMRKAQTEEDTMLERLQELAKREDKTNEEKIEAARIAEILSGKYSKLGISVDELTGDYETLQKAIAKLNDEQNEQKATALVGQINERGKLIEEQFKDIVKPGIGKRILDFVTFSDTAPVETQAANFRALSAAKQKEFAEKQKADATTDKEREAWKSLLEIIDKQIEDKERLLNLRKTDAETQKEELKTLQTNSDKAREAQEAELEAWKASVAEIDDYAKKQAEIDKKHGEELQKQLEKEQQINEEREKGRKVRRVNMVSSLAFDALRAQGKTTEAAVREAWLSESMAQGRELSSKEKNDIAEITKARLALERAQTVYAPMDYAPRVNSLIARGGSAAPVKMPKVEELQQKQLTTQESTNRIAAQILSKVGDWATI